MRINKESPITNSNIRQMFLIIVRIFTILFFI